MKACIIYDSWYGNTRLIAQEIYKGLGYTTALIDAIDARHLDLHDIDLLIVGSPTHGGMPTPAIQEFLNSIGDEMLKGVSIATFDTRVSMRWLRIVGFAARRISISLRGRGGYMIVPPQGFYVHGKEGPLKKGELERAKQWGLDVVSTWQRNHIPHYAL